MSENKDKKSGIFSKIVEAGEALLEAQISKARNSTKPLEPIESDFSFGKAVTRDRSYGMGSQGFQEKPGALSYEYLKWMAIKSSIVSAILKTRQNRVAAYSKVAEDANELGFQINLKNEQDLLDKLRKELEGGSKTEKQSDEQRSTDLMSEIKKADPQQEVPENGDAPEEVDPYDQAQEEPSEAEEFAQMSPKDQDRKLKELLKEKTQKKKLGIQEFILNCGELEDRPFETKKWNFDSYLRALVWDSLIYDQVATELIPKEAEILKGRMNIHHFQPIDGSTVRYSSPTLKNMKNYTMMSGYDILYPEEELKHLEETDALQLDDDRLERNEYRWVQVVRGRIERAFTEDELAVGFRNPVTDILANQYPICELELLIALVASHLHTEYYNRSYFQQGFSAKGILHVKANLNRSKLEELRRHWNHLVTGNKNSFQTPIMSGMDEIQWIPLTQNHNEMEFNLWLNYLIKMICAIYQIDPAEIGYGIKEAGGGGGGLSGDNTKEKLENSKDKGFVPLMRFFEAYINKNIVDKLDPDYKFEWVGLEATDPMQQLEIQDKEGRLFKTVNEIREENGLSPIEGADDLILDQTYFQWYSTMSTEAQEKQQKDMATQMNMQNSQMAAQQGQDQQAPDQNQFNVDETQKESDHQRQEEAKDNDLGRQKELATHQAKVSKSEKLQKNLKVEYYTLTED